MTYLDGDIFIVFIVVILNLSSSELHPIIIEIRTTLDVETMNFEKVAS